jgi:hypothetical protein
MPGKGTRPGPAIYPECYQRGTRGNRRHRREGTPTCANCRAEVAAAAREYRKARYLRGRRMVPVLGTCRRVHALATRGWSQAEISARLGLGGPNALSKILQQAEVKRDTADAVSALYAELAWKDGPSDLARKFAARRGWPGPMDWDDPDNPDEVPLCVIERDHAEGLGMHRAWKSKIRKRQIRAEMTAQQQSAFLARRREQDQRRRQGRGAA